MPMGARLVIGTLFRYCQSDTTHRGESADSDSDSRLRVEKKLRICSGHASSSRWICVVIWRAWDCHCIDVSTKHDDRLYQHQTLVTWKTTRNHIMVWLCTCIVPTKMLTDIKPWDLETFMTIGARKRAAKKPIV